MTLAGTVHLLRSAGGALLAQAALHAELAQLEWVAEKQRLRGMLMALLAGAVFMHCSLLSLGALVLTLAWDTPYRVTALLLLLLIYSVAAGLACHRYLVLAARGSRAFFDTREELAADLALLRSRLAP